MDSAEGLALEAEAEEEAAAPYVTPPGPVTTVAALRPGTSGHELTLKVLSSKLVRPGARISEAVVGDASGVVVMTCRNAQIEVVKAGAVITVKNGSVDMYKGSMRLVADAKDEGNVTVADSPGKFEANTSFNVSMIEYELITVPVDMPAPVEAEPVALEA